MGETTASGPASGDAIAPGQFAYDDRASKVWLYSSLFWIIFLTVDGLTMATELLTPNLFAGIGPLEFGRIRPMHVNAAIFGWLTMMYVGGGFYVLPRLLGLRSLWSEELGIWTAWLWNLSFAAGIVALGLGYTQAREYTELIWPVDVALVLALLLNIFNTIMTVMHRRVKPLYVTVWWFVASQLWLAADYVIDNVMWRPGAMLGNGVEGAGGPSGALADPLADGMLNWWGNHNLFGLWLTPMMVALIYYFIPKITRTPLYSHTLSLVSFWGIAFFYTGVGHHHLLQAPIPGWLKTFATVNSILLLVPVFAFVTNVWLTMRGNWSSFFTNIPMRFLLTGFIFYFLVNVQGAFMAVPVFNQMIHFTNFIVAHAHLALLGAFTFVGMGVISYLVPQYLGRPIYSRQLAEWQYWLIFIGFTGFFWVLTFASFLQGQNWAMGIPQINVLPEIRPHYIARAIFGAMIVMSAIVQAINVIGTLLTDTSQGTRKEFRAFAGTSETEGAAS
ncbi:cbb3-type cytochrome c oxidase subunit I [Roseibium aggregatum]|uniref:Cytochrome-c oxidase n=1 Tax=Roseibium aggregatum TaxID=187304 RepID=A0A926P373_9HYPH|nr:cbb3-type cytochrome c oxidase subunit I [Roseibium aggregatum]MBD1548765.1 cytochrome-c oxidase [Roseibium aggregatum]